MNYAHLPTGKTGFWQPATSQVERLPNSEILRLHLWLAGWLCGIIARLRGGFCLVAGNRGPGEGTRNLEGDGGRRSLCYGKICQNMGFMSLKKRSFYSTLNSDWLKYLKRQKWNRKSFSSWTHANEETIIVRSRKVIPVAHKIEVVW